MISFLPGTYGTCLLRNHLLRGVFEETGEQGFPEQAVEAIKNSVDCNIYFFDAKVETSAMYLVLIGAVFVLVGVYILLNILTGNRKKR